MWYRRTKSESNAAGVSAEETAYLVGLEDLRQHQVEHEARFLTVLLYCCAGNRTLDRSLLGYNGKCSGPFGQAALSVTHCIAGHPIRKLGGRRYNREQGCTACLLGKIKGPVYRAQFTPHEEGLKKDGFDHNRQDVNEDMGPEGRRFKDKLPCSNQSATIIVRESTEYLTKLMLHTVSSRVRRPNRLDVSIRPVSTPVSPMMQGRKQLKQDTPFRGNPWDVKAEHRA